MYTADVRKQLEHLDVPSELNWFAAFQRKCAQVFLDSTSLLGLRVHAAWEPLLFVKKFSFDVVTLKTKTVLSANAVPVLLPWTLKCLTELGDWCAVGTSLIRICGEKLLETYSLGIYCAA